MKINKQSLLKYTSILFVCLVLANAKIGGLSPFLYAFIFACIFVGIDEKFVAIFGITASLLDFSLESMLCAVSVVAIALINYYIHRLMRKKIKILTNFIVFVLSLACYVYYNYFDIKNLILFILLGLICLYVFTVVLQVMLLRKNCFQLTLDESICFLFFIAILGAGIGSVSLFKIQIYRAVLMLMILLLTAVGNPILTYSTTLSFSLGVGLENLSLIPLAEFMILSLVANIFTMPNKYKICIMVLICDIFIQYYFLLKDIALLFEIYPIAFACLIFVLIPNKSLNSLADIIYVKKSEMSSRNLINLTRKNIRRRMSELSNVFMDMKNIHLNMVKKQLTKEQLTEMFSREVMQNCCKDCLDKNRCTRSIGTDNKSNIQTLLDIAVSKGKVSLLDIPSSLTNRCGKVNCLISLVNKLSDEYRQYKNMITDVNNVKILLADQMGAVSKLLLNLGDEIDTNVRFDIAKENKIISKLLSLNIQCKEVLLYLDKLDDLSAVLIVKHATGINSTLEKVVEEVTKCPMQICKITPMEDSNFSSILLTKRGKYDCAFGLASVNKAGNEESGDCHSIIRLSKDRFLLALCDGMGSGRQASQLSALTLGLIENFYKAGFENDIILESVNKLLAINNQESYSTLDVCLLDLDNELADFIKVGAPYGLIKRESKIDVVEGGALPIGTLDNITPYTFKTTISTKDIIILATDGITDAFKTEDSLVEFVSGIYNTNPQTIAEAVLNEALFRNQMSAKDDMTVLVARTYLKN